MTYTAHLDQLTIEVASPFLKRPVLITPAQYRLLVALFDGFTGTQRELAARSGYGSAGAVNDALQQLHRLGLAWHKASRGRLGQTQARIRRGVQVLNRAVTNVRQRLEDLQNHSSKKTLSDGEHLPDLSWQALGERFKRQRRRYHRAWSTKERSWD
jgi:hypothetical protein